MIIILTLAYQGNWGIVKEILTTPTKHKTMLRQAIYLWRHYIKVRCQVLPNQAILFAFWYIWII